MMTHPLPVAGKFPIQNLVARQLPTNYNTLCGSTNCTFTHTGSKFKVKWIGMVAYMCQSLWRSCPRTIIVELYYITFTLALDK